MSFELTFKASSESQLWVEICLMTYKIACRKVDCQKEESTLFY